jgi:hypothetical protein
MQPTTYCHNTVATLFHKTTKGQGADTLREQTPKQRFNRHSKQIGSAGRAYVGISIGL